jgi:hypothetical protein
MMVELGLGRLLSAALALAAGVSFGIAPLPASAALLVYNGAGEIAGVDGLEVYDQVSNGLLAVYDVSFEEGTCIEFYSGCDNNNDDLPFSSAVLRNAAFDALAGALGDLDDPSSIAGCESSIECYVTALNGVHLIPNQISGYGLYLLAGLANDLIVSESFAGYRDQDFALVANRTWALFSPSAVIDPPSEVPAPAALVLMLSGLAGLGVAGRRKNRS